MRVLFFGNSRNSLSPLRRLGESKHQIVGVVSPVGRGPKERWRRVKTQARREAIAQLGRFAVAERFFDQDLDFALARLAHDYGAPLIRPESINDSSTIDAIAKLRPDIVVMVGFNQILKAPLIDRLPTILNVHPSALPAYRGPAPFFWVIARGETQTGVTVHEVTPGIDTGPIVAQKQFDVPSWFTSGDLRARCGEVAGELLLSALDQERTRLPQEGEGSYYGVVTPEHLVAPIPEGATAVYNRARAAAPDDPLRVFVPRAWWNAGASTKGAPVSQRPEDGLQELYVRHAVAPLTGQGAPNTASHDPRAGLYLHCEGGSVLFRGVEVPRSVA